MAEVNKYPLDADEKGWFVRLGDITDLAIHRKAKEAYVQIIDGRPLSGEQRRMCYALINSVSEWSGQPAQDLKELFKMQFMAENIQDLGDKIFSLSDAPMSLIASFQRFLIKFIIENDVPVKRPLLEYVDDVNDYVYHCLINKKCCICGKKADLHHVDAVGMGRDRTEIVHLGMRALPLCREHHTEAHTRGDKAFIELYHLCEGIEIDKTLCKIYKLKGK